MNEKKKLAFSLSPPQTLVLGFAVIILIGSFLLSLPVASTSGQETPFLDALFTATSATCVTGLIVVDTGSYFNTFGQVVILLLIQVGGLGFMTMATLFAIVFKKRISFRERLLLQEAMNQISVEGIVRLIRKVVAYAFGIELFGAILFAIRWAPDLGWRKAMFFGAFHAVSFFNNAGFDLFGNSLINYVNDPLINIVSLILIILGGLGFVVISDLLEWKRKKHRLSLHTKVVLSMNFSLILFAWIVIFIFEFTNAKTLGPLNVSGKLFASLFQAVTPRTAGANTLNIPDLRQATQFFMILLMFVGASPGSTGGGIKTTTFATLIGAIISMVRGKEDIVMFRFRLPKERVFKAITIAFLSLFLIIFVAMVLSTTEDHQFLVILFETTSAFGTVGLSMGLTPLLTPFGKVMIMLTMFAGRLGLLTLAYALSKKQDKELYRHPEGKIIIG